MLSIHCAVKFHENVTSLVDTKVTSFESSRFFFSNIYGSEGKIDKWMEMLQHFFFYKSSPLGQYIEKPFYIASYFIIYNTINLWYNWHVPFFIYTFPIFANIIFCYYERISVKFVTKCHIHYANCLWIINKAVWWIAVIMFILYLHLEETIKSAQKTRVTTTKWTLRQLWQ